VVKYGDSAGGTDGISIVNSYLQGNNNPPMRIEQSFSPSRRQAIYPRRQKEIQTRTKSGYHKQLDRRYTMRWPLQKPQLGLSRCASLAATDWSTFGSGGGTTFLVLYPR
jgi:hypothetical protein